MQHCLVNAVGARPPPTVLSSAEDQPAAAGIHVQPSKDTRKKRPGGIGVDRGGWRVVMVDRSAPRDHLICDNLEATIAELAGRGRRAHPAHPGRRFRVDDLDEGSARREDDALPAETSSGVDALRIVGFGRVLSTAAKRRPHVATDDTVGV
jgi:hypothetical protein